MRHHDWLIRQLPVGMTEDEFLVRFLTIFQNLSDTVLQQVDSMPHLFDPTVAPESMVRLMARWLGVDWVDSSLDDRLQREIVMRYSDLLQWRGTRRGLSTLLELLSGADVEVIDTGGVYPQDESPAAPPHVTITLQSAGWNSVDDLIRIVRDELPAHVTFELVVAGRVEWPRAVVAASGQRPAATPDAQELEWEGG